MTDPTVVYPITATIEDGDYGCQYAVVTINGVEITVYQSHVRPGGITVDIDTPAGMPDSLVAISIND